MRIFNINIRIIFLDFEKFLCYNEEYLFGKDFFCEMKVLHYMDLAKNMANLSTFHRQKMGCVVVSRKCVISAGMNSSKTHPLQKEYNKMRYPDDNTPHSLHAEMAALIPLQYANIDWNKVSLFVYRKGKRDRKNGLLARPCPACMTYIKSLGIKNIYYSNVDGIIHEVLDC